MNIKDCQIILAAFVIIAVVLNHVSFVCTFGQTTACYNAQQCVFDVIDANATTVECWGYRSCLQADITSDNGIQCYGSHSCIAAKKLESTDGVIECGGLMSCAGINTDSNSIITYDNAYIHCTAEQSCANSNIKIFGTGPLNCLADHSCANSIATSSNGNSFYGSLSAQNAVFFSNDSHVTYGF